MDLPRPVLAPQNVAAQHSPQLSPMLPPPQRRAPVLPQSASSINAAPDERSALLHAVPDSAPRGWSDTAVNVATVAAQTTDAIGAGLSLSASLATPGSTSAVAQNLVSGSSWAVSGVIGAVTGRATSAAWATGAGVFNAFAGTASVTSTGFGTADAHSWQAEYVAPAASSFSNLAWAGAGAATIGDGVSTFRNARNWSATFAGTAQIVSGAANVVAGAAGLASTYLQAQNPADPRAAVASVVSGAAWVTGSAFGAIGAGLSWYSRRGSASPSGNPAQRELDV